MNRRALLVVPAAAVVLLAGCGGQPAAPRTSAAPASSTTPTVTPLVTPTELPGEVVRSVLSGGSVEEPSAPMPRSGQLAVDVACWGADGSTMSWRLVAGDGSALGLSGTADCSGPPTTSWLGVTATERPARVRVDLRAASGAVSGWAIVRRGTP
ncbi:hypothetical protein [Amnibacterium kyonggiense]|uniref:Secreted protein n=1 Tax=Amnibacterium kyonggiense TaxID=595671 RepID=A0A4V3EBE3_9MICO|nr:hypothetical protein [Amnibacterium kyonggiense]TDS80744.1 hypothetical protein CLV52_1313 [Amnibacterium kyonggiense]